MAWLAKGNLPPFFLEVQASQLLKEGHTCVYLPFQGHHSMYGGRTPRLTSTPVALGILHLTLVAEGGAEGDGKLTVITPVARPSTTVQAGPSAHGMPQTVKSFASSGRFGLTLCPVLVVPGRSRYIISQRGQGTSREPLV